MKCIALARIASPSATLRAWYKAVAVRNILRAASRPPAMVLLPIDVRASSSSAIACCVCPTTSWSSAARVSSDT